MLLIQVLQISASDHVGLVGFIEPIARQIRQWTSNLVVFDEAKNTLAGISDLDEMPDVLPHCNVLILSATTLLNKTFDSLLSLSSHAREVCLMGPSTPLLPDFFRTRGITVLAGRRVVDADKLLQIVSEAGGTKRFRTATEKVDIVLKKGNNQGRRPA